MENPYLNPTRVRAALRALDLRPSRDMGQNFLVDPDALATIAEAAGLTADDTVVEVGPGLGVLTWELLRRAGRVIAVELDLRLADRLGQEFAGEPRLTTIQGDILKLAPDRLLSGRQSQTTEDGGWKIEDGSLDASEKRSSIPDPPSSSIPYKVVANLPYAITSPALRHFLEAGHKPALMVVLVQWEVAQRIAAGPGDLSVLAHAIQVYAEPEIVARVPAGSFIPAPAVDSAVLRLRVRPRPAVDVDNIDALLRVVKAGFLHARKKLANALPGGLAAMGAPVPKERVLAALESAGVDPGRRAETVTLEEWARVYRHLARP